MTRGATGLVGPDGQSALSGGLYDMAELANDAVLDEEVEEKLSKLFSADLDDAKARFKLEVCFSQDRSLHKPFFGMVSVWTNGGFLHGGGDEVVYLCPTKISAKDGGSTTCAEPLHIQFVSKRVAVCPKCKTAHNPKALVGQVMARLPLQHWVTLIHKMFTRLDCNADIVLEHVEGDIRQANDKEMERDRGGEVYDSVRNKRMRIAYPLANILKDTAAGATLEGRLRAFLLA